MRFVEKEREITVGFRVMGDCGEGREITGEIRVMGDWGEGK